jgi:hypothetical protein
VAHEDAPRTGVEDGRKRIGGHAQTRHECVRVAVDDEDASTRVEARQVDAVVCCIDREPLQAQEVPTRRLHTCDNAVAQGAIRRAVQNRQAGHRRGAVQHVELVRARIECDHSRIGQRRNGREDAVRCCVDDGHVVSPPNTYVDPPAAFVDRKARRRDTRVDGGDARQAIWSCRSDALAR